MTQTKKRRPLRGAMMLAAAVALLAALSAAALAFNMLGLRDALIPDRQPVGKLDEEGILVPGETVYVDMISLSGYANSPAAKAHAEWQEFLNGYDVQGAAIASDEYYYANGCWPVDMDRYENYQVYDQTMADKLEEIVAKYGLNLRGGMHDITSAAEWNAQMGGDCLGETRFFWGYYYDDGTCNFEGAAPVEGREIDFQFHRAVKTTFDGGSLNIGDADTYEQWEYTAACGERVLLCLGPIRGLVFADFEDSFVCINVLSGYEEGWLGSEAITRSHMEKLADAMDVSLLHPAVPYRAEG